MKARDFFKDLFTVDLAPDEIIVGVQFAPVRAAAYAKLHQRASHFAIVGVAAALEISNGTIRVARIGLTGAGPHAIRLTNVEEALAGQALSTETIDAAARLAGSDLQSDQRRHPRQRGVPPGDDPGLYPSRFEKSARPHVACVPGLGVGRCRRAAIPGERDAGSATRDSLREVNM